MTFYLIERAVALEDNLTCWGAKLYQLVKKLRVLSLGLLQNVIILTTVFFPRDWLIVGVTPRVDIVLMS
jgi:hypothetical protein